MDLGGLGVGGVDPGPDRPHRLVGEDDPSDRVGREAGQACAELALDRRERQALPALVGRLADAEDRGDAVHERGLDLAIDLLIRLADLTAPLRVPDQHVAAAHFHEHGQGDLSGVRARRLPVTILSAESQRSTAEDLVDCGQGRERWTDHDVDPAGPLEAIANRGRQRPALGDRPLHLPVANAERNPHQRASVRASTPGSVRPSRNSRKAPPAVEM